METYLARLGSSLVGGAKKKSKRKRSFLSFLHLATSTAASLPSYSVRIPRFCSVSSCLQFLLCSQPLHANFQGFSARILTAPG